jgi:regulator of G-protein signaling
MDIKKACRMHRPIKSARHLSVAVAGGRISPSVSEVDIQCPAATIQKEIEFLRKKLARTNIKVSKVAESYISFYEQYVEYDPFVTCTEPLNPWISDTLDFWDQDKSGYYYHPRLIFSFMSISFSFFIPLLSLASLTVFVP